MAPILACLMTALMVPPAAAQSSNDLAVSLSPETATNPGAARHCVTASVTVDGSGDSVPGEFVIFDVLDAGDNELRPSTRLGPTDAAGEVEFCYGGPDFDRTDTIRAVVDEDSDHTIDPTEASDTAEKVWRQLFLELDPGVATNPAGTRHCVTATLTEVQSGTPVPGEFVIFDVLDSTDFKQRPSTRLGPTDAAGEVEFCYHGPNQDRIDDIRAVVDTNRNGEPNGNEPAAVAEKQWNELFLELDPGVATNPAGTRHCVTATLTEVQSGTPVPGEFVIFDVLDSTDFKQRPSTRLGPTDAAGEVEFCYHGPNQDRIDDIRAVVDTNRNGEPNGNEPAAVAEKVWRQLFLELDPGVATNPAGTRHCVTATLTEVQSGTPVPGEFVIFDVLDSTDFKQRPSTRLGPTDAAGEVEFCYHGPNQDRIDDIRAVVDTNRNGEPNGNEPAAVAEKQWNELFLELDPGVATNPAGTRHCVTATLTEVQSGTPVPGEFVIFDVLDSTDFKQRPSTRLGPTDAAGEVEFCYHGPNQDRIDDIRAVVDTNRNGEPNGNEPAAVAEKQWNELFLELDPGVATNPAGTRHCVTATLTEVQSGTPVPGEFVIFDVLDSTDFKQRPSTRLGPTDAAGEVEFCYHGPNQDRIDDIRAVVDTNRNGEPNGNEPAAVAEKVWRQLFLELDPGVATNPAGTRHCVTATLTEVQSGTPVPGEFVIFDVLDSTDFKQRPSTRLGPTDAAGEVEFCYHGPNQDRIDDIRAVVDTNRNGEPNGNEPAAVAEKVWRQLFLELDPGVATNPAGTRHCVTATLTEVQSGTPVPGEFVIFDVLDSTDFKQRPSTRLGPTDAAGEVEFCYAGPNLVRDDFIQAVVDTNRNGEPNGSEPLATAEKQWTAAAADAFAIRDAVVQEGDAGTTNLVFHVDRYGDLTTMATVKYATHDGSATQPSDYQATSGTLTFLPGEPGHTFTVPVVGDQVDEPDEDFEVLLSDAVGIPISNDRAQGFILNDDQVEAVQVELDPNNAEHPVGNEHCTTAHVTATSGNFPVADQPVVFEAYESNGFIVAHTETVTTDADGEALFCYRGPLTQQEQILNAYVDSNGNGTEEEDEANDGGFVFWFGVQVELDPNNAEHPVGNEHCTTAHVTATSGNFPVADQPVVFEAYESNGFIVAHTETVTTDADGEALFCYRGPLTQQEQILNAYVDSNGNGTEEEDEANDGGFVFWFGVQVELDPNNAEHPVGNEHCTTAHVTATSGNFPVADQPVVFEAYESNGFIVAHTETVTTDADGEALFCYRGPLTQQEQILNAYVDSNGNGTEEEDEANDGGFVFWFGVQVELDPNNAEHPVGNEHCTTAHVTATSGNFPVADQPVVFEAYESNGFIVAHTETVTTDADGEALFCYRGPLTQQEQILNAYVDSNGNGTEEEDEANDGGFVFWFGVQVELDPNNAEHPVGNEHCTTAHVTATSGNFPVADQPVVFEAYESNGFIVAHTETVTTDADGEALFCYRGPLTQQEQILNAYVDSNGNGTEEEDEANDGGFVFWFGVQVELDPNNAEHPVGNEHCTTAHVTATSGNFPVADQPVVFEAYESNGFIVAHTETVTTDADGEALFCYRGPLTQQEQILNAYVDSNGNGTEEEDEANDGGFVFWFGVQVELDPNNAEHPVGNEHCTTAHVTATSGNFPVADQPVTFEAEGPDMVHGPYTVLTNADGEALFCYRGPLTQQVHELNAYVDSNGNGTEEEDEANDGGSVFWHDVQIEVNPDGGFEPVGEEHCETAHVTAFGGGPVPDQPVILEAYNSAGDLVHGPTREVTDSDGEALFCYTGPSTAADHELRFYVDSNDNGTQQEQEVSTSAVVSWEEFPTVSIDDAAATEGEDATFTVELSEASNFEASVHYSTSPGTADEGSDYASESGDITFAPGDTSKQIAIETVEDNIDEPLEDFVVELSDPVNASLGDAEGLGEIADDDDQPGVTIDDATLPEGNSGTSPAVFKVRLSNPSSSQVIVDYETEDDSATTADGDYGASADSVTFAAGDTVKEITVQVNGDVVEEADEQFLVNLTAATNAIITDDQAIGTIENDDDEQPAVQVTKTAAPTTVQEPGGDVTFLIEVKNTSSEDVTLTDLTDDVHGDLDGKGSCTVGGSIASGATFSCSFTQHVAGSAGDEETDTVTATVIDDEGNEVSGSGSATVTIVERPPATDRCDGLQPTLVGTEGNDKLTGTDGPDVIVGSGGNDIIKGQGGNDVLCGGDGNDTIDGQGGDDTIDGGAGNDDLRGQGGDDEIEGGTGNDRIRGEGGEDTLSGGDGDDSLLGEGGDDVLDGGAGHDSLNGGGHNDSCTTGEVLRDCEAPPGGP